MVANEETKKDNMVRLNHVIEAIEATPDDKIYMPLLQNSEAYLKSDIL